MKIRLTISRDLENDPRNQKGIVYLRKTISKSFRSLVKL